MIDSTTSPVPVWKRYATMIVLAIFVLVGAYLIYTKEIHHPSGSSGSSAAPTAPAPVATSPTTVKPSAPGPIGGIPISNRSPFS